jgi:phospholipase C
MIERIRVTASRPILLALGTLALARAPSAEPMLTSAGATDTAGAAQYREIAQQAALSDADKWRLLRRHLKYVFIIFQENRSFDQHFGTYPGADGLFADGARRPVPGSTQRIRSTDGTDGTIAPFLIPRAIKDADGRMVPLYPEDTASVDHSHNGILNGMHFSGDHGAAALDGFALNQERLHYAGDAIVGVDGKPPTSNPTLAQKQAAELALAHIDCDTIPFLWQYADRFTLFDDFHATTIAPSAPNAIAMIAGQTGETQWALHPDQADPKGLTLPNATDSGPFAGSSLDHATPKLPYGPEVAWIKPQRVLTFATLPLSFMGPGVNTLIAGDPDPAQDLPDIQNDIAAVARRGNSVPWAWYQQGLGAEPFDDTTTQDGIAHPPHASYIVHHNAPQYFGYLGRNERAWRHMRALQDFFDDVAARRLPEAGGVFYVRGGFYNNDGLMTLNPNPRVRKRYAGNDDHPGYADAQISEAHVASVVNAIAASPYWQSSVIVITYDETDGLYDHVAPRVRVWGPDALPLAGGPRIPAIVISPYAAAHTVAHAYSEHSSVIRFINQLFGLVPLADLPDEQRARALGARILGQGALGPADDFVAPMGDLADAFDNDRLLGNAAPLPADYAMIAPARIRALPHDGGAGCAALNITPTDYRNGVPIDPPPADFNPRPVDSPGIPSAGGWTP